MDKKNQKIDKRKTQGDICMEGLNMLKMMDDKNKNMKVKSSIRKEKPGDQLVRRRGKLYRINKINPRRKARQR